VQQYTIYFELIRAIKVQTLTLLATNRTGIRFRVEVEMCIFS